MENFSYVQDGGRNYLKSEPVGEVDYIVGMFAHNDIPAFVPVSFKSLNLENYFCYNMNGLIPINQSFEMNKLTADRIEAFLHSIIKAAKSMEEFLLPFDRLITDEAYIYESLGKKDEFHWIYGIESGNATFTRLFERLLDRVDYKDDSAVKMIYSLYQAAKESEGMQGVSTGGSLQRIREKAEEILSAPHMSLDMRARELIRAENERNSIKRLKDIETGTGDKTCSKEIEGADSMARRYRAEAESKKSRLQRVDIEDTPKAKISLFKQRQNEEKSDKTMFVKSKLKKVWDYLNADIGSKPEKLVDLQAVGENEISYNVREVKQPKIEASDNAGEATTLLTGAMISNGIYCLKPEDTNEDNILLTEFPFFIGKSGDKTHHTIEDSTVSRFHARIDREEEELWLTDLNSTNGTFLNGIRLMPFGRMRVNKGDSIVISRKRYEFKYLV
jgi:hypothetical protein